MWSIENEQGLAAARVWLANMIASISEGGIWIVPRAGTSYKLWPSQKRFERTIGDGDEAIERVLASMGWARKLTVNEPITAIE